MSNEGDMSRRFADPREVVDTMFRLERLRHEVGVVRTSREERERLSKARALLRLQRLKQEYESWGGNK